jgi:hypothetical protein
VQVCQRIRVTLDFRLSLRSPRVIRSQASVLALSTMKRLLLIPLYVVVPLIGCFVLTVGFAKTVAKNLRNLLSDGCAHRQLTWPIGRRCDSAPYVVCLQCGRRFEYDWPEMRATPNARLQNQAPRTRLENRAPVNVAMINAKIPNDER